MAVRIRFDRAHNVIQPTFVLATRNGKKLGVIKAENIQVSDSMNTYFDLSFQVQKELDGIECVLWDQIEDFKLVWCREWDVWFEIHVEISESNNTVKNINAISLGESELSEINLYGIEINTENDIAREDYDVNYPTILYRDTHTEASLLHRIMEKAPHYKIKHVDASIRNIQRTFTFDNTSLYDAFQQISQEINCIFIINSGTNADGKIAREISVYDLESYCLDCGHRDNYFKTCPKCNSTNVSAGYGEDTTIFISTDNLADNITYSTDKDSVKNCFKLEAGDDLMTASIANCNPNGSGYIWYISDIMKRDMSNELVQRLDEYDKNYDYYQNTHTSIISNNELVKYNALINKYFNYNEDLEMIPESIIGYPALMTAYYNTIDFYLYLRSGLMPNVEMQDTNANQEASNLALSLNHATVAVQKLSSCSSSTASSAVLSMAKVIVDARYQVKVKEGMLNGTTWTGVLTITNYSDDEDTATTDIVSIKINDNQESYIKQKIDTALNKNKTDDATEIVSLFNLDIQNFKIEIQKYSLTGLETFRDACQTCLDILIEQGIADNKTWADENPNLYEELYMPYYNKNSALLEEIKLREEEIAVIIGTHDAYGDLVTYGLQNLIEEEQIAIQDILNFEKFLGEDLWMEFVAYRREDTYSNTNYISDGLNNEEIFKNALEFIEVARKEIYKSATLQHSIAATLKNLLVMKEFKPIIDYFCVGNWIRVRIDKQIYRLRLLSYTIDFDNLDNISIEFSDVLKCADGISDVESVLNQAASISKSYDATQRQASQGRKGKEHLDNWVEKGLSLTNMKIINDSDNIGITIDSHGLLCREYLPLTDTYDDKQLKIINKGLYLTDDNWLTAKAGIGNFNYYNPINGEIEEAYGVIADTLIGNLILSEQVGIYNQNNSITLDENGLIITTDYDESTNTTSNLAFTIQKKVVDAKGNESVRKLLYIDDNGNLVLNGSISIFTNTNSSTNLNDVVGNIKDLGDAIAGMDGLFFYIRYSENENGIPMTERPTENTLYIGTCSTSANVAPTDPDKYIWCKIKGNDGTNGTPGQDGKSQYFHVKYSNDGETFTSNNGETLGDWMGTCVTEQKEDPMDFDVYEWHKIKGETGTAGLDGKDGIAGKDGQNGQTTYFHVRYSSVENPTAADMTETPSKYIGTYVDFTEKDSDNPSDYTWVQFMGKDGIDGKDGQNGIPGTNGKDGQTYYLHIKYSDDNGKTFTANNGETSGKYIGVYTDTTQADSTDISKYTWSLIKGADGINYYTWLKYADTPTSGMSDNPEGKKYMGIAYNKTVQQESTNYSDYTWSLIKGEDGSDGINGINGIDGKNYYTWVKYADDNKGTNMSNDPSGKYYIGLAYNKETSTESNNASDYTWSLFRGSDGVNGKDGANGVSTYFYVRFSANSNGSSMTTSPTTTTKYMGVCSTTASTAPTDYTKYTWTQCKGNDGTNGTPGEKGDNGQTQYLHIKYSDDGEVFTGNDGEDLGAWIGTLVDFVEADSTNFDDYTWKKFTEDVDDELLALGGQIQNGINDLYGAIDNAVNDLNNTLDSKIDGVSSSIVNQINIASSSIDTKYQGMLDQVNEQLNNYKAEIGQYLDFNDDGLIIGSSSSEFKTLIDNKGMYFKQGNTIVSYVNNKQLYIPNAVIENTLILGKFFFSPRSDGGVSLTWQGD